MILAAVDWSAALPLAVGAFIGAAGAIGGQWLAGRAALESEKLGLAHQRDEAWRKEQLKTYVELHDLANAAHMDAFSGSPQAVTASVNLMNAAARVAFIASDDVRTIVEAMVTAVNQAAFRLKVEEHAADESRPDEARDRDREALKNFPNVLESLTQWDELSRRYTDAVRAERRRIQEGA